MYWDPFDEMKRFRKEMDNMFERVFRRDLNLSNKDIDFKHPLDNVAEKDNEVIVKLNMPGVEKKDIILNITEDYVEVKAEKKEEIKIEKKGMRKYERSYKGYHKVLPLPAKVNAENAVAEYKDGTLTIKIPKKGKKVIEKKKIIVK